MALKSDEKSIYDLFLDTSFLVPMNQRKYVWSEDNWIELMNDINLVRDKKIQKHYIGSIVLKDEGEKDGLRKRMSIIDGQQRIITITIMLSAIATLLLERGMFDELGALNKQLLVIDNKNKHYPMVGEDANVVVSRIIERISDKYESRTKASKDEIICLEKKDAKEEKCFLFFYGEFYEKKRSLLNYLEIIKNISYIQILADKDEDAYSIFESLNARGQALGNFDLLRNYLLKHIKNKENASKELNKIENRLGEDVEIFLKHYVKHKYELKPKDKKIMPYKIISQRESKGELSKFLKDLNLKSIYYKRIIDPSKDNKNEYFCFKYFKSKRQQQFRPIILGMMHQAEINDEMTNVIYSECIEYLYRFFICFHVVGEEKSNKIDDIIDKYSHKFENEFSLCLIDDFKKSLSKRMLDRDSFCAKLNSVRFSNKHIQHSGSKNHNKVRSILEVYERTLGYDNDFDELSLTIEHIFPDSESIENSVLGNLMLLEHEINKDIKNYNINAKYPSYNNSKLIDPKLVANLISSRNFDIKARQNDICDKIYNYIINK